MITVSVELFKEEGHFNTQYHSLTPILKQQQAAPQHGSLLFL